MTLIECVPNVSEGRRTAVIAALAEAIAASGVHLLDRSSDPSHNRTVYTFVGGAEALQQAVLRLFASAIAHIDLGAHSGVHPRIGAVDVVPFVPLRGAAMSDCIDLARSTAALVSERFGVPVYLYEEAASRAARRNLAEIRRGGLAKLATRIREDEWLPDFGAPEPHPTAGVSAIGARRILIAYNVNLETNRVEVAKRIAGRIRTSGGGFDHVKAMGVLLDHRGVAQVSMNLTDYHCTPMTTVFDAVVREAADEGVEVLDSEIVGLVPADALPSDPVERLKLSPVDANRVLERRLQQAGLG
ncbi:MAG TPA: glutamate formimidoyltransferase [Vicinamibacterales bacterium]|jgi:glutamate formiminotransferase|nr:glutamate formimidoyltransferase [Vicinamibacterales bacterium]